MECLIWARCKYFQGNERYTPWCCCSQRRVGWWSLVVFWRSVLVRFAWSQVVDSVNRLVWRFWTILTVRMDALNRSNILFSMMYIITSPNSIDSMSPLRACCRCSSSMTSAKRNVRQINMSAYLWWEERSWALLTSATSSRLVSAHVIASSCWTCWTPTCWIRCSLWTCRHYP